MTDDARVVEMRRLLEEFAEFEWDGNGYCEWCGGTYPAHVGDCIYPQVRAVLDVPSNVEYPARLLRCPGCGGLYDADTELGTPCPHGQEIGRLQPQTPKRLWALVDAVRPFAEIMLGSSGRIPTERLSADHWHTLTRAFTDVEVNEPNPDNAPVVDVRAEGQALIERLNRAHKMIGDMCTELRPPKMSIPARPDRDEDLVICHALRDAACFIEEHSGSVPKMDVPPWSKDTPAGRRECIAAFTAPGGSYPAYVNVSVDGRGRAHLTVRGPRRDDGSEGPTAAIELSMCEFLDICGLASKDYVEAHFSAARQDDLARQRADNAPKGGPKC